MKPLTWIGDSRERLRAATPDVRQDAGRELELVQYGRDPRDSRLMPEVGSGVMEIRVHGDSEFRVFYVARFEESVYVLHCFVKKTSTTRRADIDLGKRRYAELLRQKSTK